MRSLSCTLAALALVGAVAPAPAADFQDVVLLANEDLFAGYNDVWGFVGTNGREYVIQGTSVGTAWWDVEDPLHPALVTFLDEPASPWRDMFVIGNHAFIVAENFDQGVRVVDISDPTAPTHVASYTTTVNQAHNIFGDPSRNLLYVVGGSSNGANGGVQILDATDPLNLVEIAQWNQHYVHDMSVEGQYGYLCLIYLDELQIVDLADSTSPVTLGAYIDPIGSVHACWPVGNGQHVLLTHETQGGHLRSVDVSNPLAPVSADEWNPAPTSSAHNVHVQGNLAFVSWYARGTRVIDVSDPTALVEVGWWDTNDGIGLTNGNWGVYPHLPSGLVASNDRDNGLFLLKYDPDAGVLDGTVTPASGSFAFGATVDYLDLETSQDVDSTGAYRFSAFAGPSHTLRFSAFGYAPDSATVALAPGGTTTTNVVLARLPFGGLSGTVTDGQTSQPLLGADAIVVGTPLVAVTDASGHWSLPEVPAGPVTVVIRRGGYATQSFDATVPVGFGANVDAGLEPAAVYVDFSNPVGWTEDNDPNVVGTWTFDDPYGTYLNGELFQPEDDHTPGEDTDCAVTGNFTDGVDDGDVDDGATRLISPVYDLSSMVRPHVFYYRWFATEQPLDPWEVEASSDGGATWILIETTNQDERFWKGVDVDLLPVLSSFGSVRFRFIAQDQPPEQILEACVDDFTLYDAGSGGTGVGETSRTALSLSPPAPNPFASSTTIRFALPATAHTTIRVLDVRGALVATLEDRVLGPGAHSVVWDGRTRAGRPAAAGVYLVELRHGDVRQSVKMLRSR